VNALTVSGWSSAPESPQVIGNTRLTVLYKIAVGADARTSNDTGDHQIGKIMAIKKGTFNEGSPFNASAGGTQAKTKSVSIPGATTTVPECLIIAIACGNLPDAATEAEFGAATNASLTSITDRIDNTTAEGDGGAIFAITGIKATAGAYNATTCTAVTEAERGVLSLAIAPPAVAWKKELSDTVSVSDSLAKLPGKILADTVATADAMVKKPAKILADSATTADVIAKQPRKSLADTQSLSDAILAQRLVVKLLADTVSVADAISKTALKLMPDTQSLVDAFTKRPAKSLADSVTTADGIAKTAAKALADTQGVTDAVAKKPSKGLADTATVADAIYKLTHKLLADTVSVLDKFSFPQFIGTFIRYLGKWIKVK
jgi:hypothetical protein